MSTDDMISEALMSGWESRGERRRREASEAWAEEHPSPSSKKELTDREVADQLIAELEKVPNKQRKGLCFGKANFSVAELIADVRSLTPLGIAHVRLYRAVLEKVSRGEETANIFQ